MSVPSYFIDLNRKFLLLLPLRFRQRLVAKFTENDHEKVERLMELHFKYLERVEFAEHKIAKEGLDKIEDEEEIYLRRLSGGLFSLQLIGYIIVDSCSSGASSVKQRVLKILNQRNASIYTFLRWGIASCLKVARIFFQNGVLHHA